MSHDNQYYAPLSPLSIQPISEATTSAWSPFSAPSFSPYESNQQTYFQYSSYTKDSEEAPRKNLPRPIGSGRYNQNITVQQSYQSKQAAHQRSNKLPKRSDQFDLTDIIRQASIQKATGGRTKSCTFCRTNGEPELIYTSHSLKDASDKITCPILMRYVCPDCGATGEKTHTKKYCPVLQKGMLFVMTQ